MHVKDFMTPIQRVTMVRPEAKLEVALNLMVETPDLGAIVVISEGDPIVPCGIVAKADLMKAYQRGLDPKSHKVQEIMGTHIEDVAENATREQAAHHFEETKHKNAFVFSKERRFVGMVSALDVCFEVARADHAWPWNREGLAHKYTTA